MFRTALITAATAALLLTGTVPGFAGPREAAFLQSLGGTWAGSGTMSGGQTGRVVCKMVMKPSSRKVSYNGRCNVPDVGAQSFTGTITYNDSKGRYEARSRSGTAIGVQRGSSVVFATSSKTMQGQVASTMRFSASSIVIDFNIVERKSGETTTSSIRFSR